MALDKLTVDSETGGSSVIKLNSWADQIDELTRITQDLDHTGDHSTFAKKVEYLYDQLATFDPSTIATSKELASVSAVQRVFEILSADSMIKRKTITDFQQINMTGIYDGDSIPGGPLDVDGNAVTGLMTILATKFENPLGTGYKLILFDKDGSAHFGQVAMGYTQWSNVISDIIKRLDRGGVDRVYDCASLKGGVGIQPGKLVTTTNETDWELWKDVNNKNIYLSKALNASDTSEMTACIRGVFERVQLNRTNQVPGTYVYADNLTSSLSFTGDVAVAVVLKDHGSQEYDIWYDPTQFGSSDNVHMKGFFNASVDGGNISKPIVNGSMDYTQDDYLIVIIPGNYDFSTGTASQSGTLLDVGERIRYDGLVWRRIGVPGSSNKGWFDPNIDGGGAGLPSPIIDGTNAYRNGDYVIAIQAGFYDLSDGTTHVDGSGGAEEVKVGDRLAYDGNKWAVVTMSHGSMQGWFNPTLDGGGGHVSFPVADNSSSYMVNHYIIAEADGYYNFGLGQAAPTPGLNVTQVKRGTRFRYDGLNWKLADTIFDEKAIKKHISQVNHTFTVFTAIYVNDFGVWTRANASDINRVQIGLVSEVIDVNTFVVTFLGIIEVHGHGFNVGRSFYLTTNDGAISENAPTTGVIQKVAFSIDQDNMYVMNDILDTGSNTSIPIIPVFTEDTSTYYPQHSVVKHNEAYFRLNEGMYGQSPFPYSKADELGTKHRPDATLKFFTAGSNLGQVGLKWDTGSLGWQMGAQVNGAYSRTSDRFNWYVGGQHTDNADDPGPGGSIVMTLDSNGVRNVNRVRISKDQLTNPVDDRELVTKEWCLSAQQGATIALHIEPGGVVGNGQAVNTMWTLRKIATTGKVIAGQSYILKMYGMGASINNSDRYYQVRLLRSDGVYVIAEGGTGVLHKRTVASWNPEGVASFVRFQSPVTAENVMFELRGNTVHAWNGNWWVAQGGMMFELVKA